MYISPINKKYFKNIQNLDIEIKGPAFNQVVYEEKAGSITSSKVIFNKYWFYSIYKDGHTYICVQETEDFENWKQNSSIIDDIPNCILKIKTEKVCFFIDSNNNINIIYLSFDKKGREKYFIYQYINNSWSFLSSKIDYIGLIYDIEWTGTEYNIYFSKDFTKENNIYHCNNIFLTKTEDFIMFSPEENILEKEKIISFNISNFIEKDLYFYSCLNDQNIYVNNSKYYQDFGNKNISGFIKDVNYHHYFYYISNNQLKFGKFFLDRIVCFHSNNKGFFQTELINTKEFDYIYVNYDTKNQVILSILNEKNEILESHVLKNGAANYPIIYNPFIKKYDNIYIKVEVVDGDFFYIKLVKADTIKKNIEITQDWWSQEPIIMFSGCGWSATGGAQRPVALSRELSKLGYPVIYCSYANLNEEIIYIDGVYILPSSIMKDYLLSLLNSNKKGTLIVTLANYHHYAEMFKKANWKVIYDMLDDWDVFFESKDLIKQDDFDEENLIKNSDYITCSASYLVKRASKMFDKKKISLVRNGGPNYIVQKTLPPEDMLTSSHPLCIYSGYLGGSWLDWEYFQILENRNICTNVVGALKYDVTNVPIRHDINQYQKINFVDEKPFNEALQYMAASHIGIIPFQDEKICRAVDPIKAYDYWAAGLWCVASPEMIELKDRDFVILAEKKDWPKAIKEAYKQVELGNIPSEKFVLENSWFARAKEYKKIIEKIQPKKNKTYRVSLRPHLKEEDCKLRITVQTPATCNMKPSCPYCMTEADRQNKNTDFYGEPNQWLNSLSWLSEEYGPLYLSSCYGEPLSSRNSIYLYSELAKGNLVDIVSNIIAPMEDINKFPKNGNVRFATSFHPHYWNIEEFIEKRQQIEKSGYHCGITLIVAYPSILIEIPGWLKTLQQAGINTQILAFQGYNLYPDSYSPKDKEYILGLSNSYTKTEETELNKDTRKKKCWVGIKYMTILWNGDVYQCPQKSRKLGNILENNIQLLKEPQYCLAGQCTCPDLYQFIIDE